MTKPKDNSAPTIDPTCVRFLTPAMCRIHLGTHGALHVTVVNERIYGGVYAAYAFPVAHPDEYIALIHSAGEDKDVEIGIIRDLNAFPPADVELVRAALRRRYFVHTITSIDHIGWKYGYIGLSVQTDKGPAEFLLRWRHDAAVDYGRRGKVLIDVDDNRFLIPDLDALPPRQRGEFKRYIYW